MALRHWLLAQAAATVTTAALMANYNAIPLHNTDAKHFDAIIVLGTPTLDDGTPSPEQRERVEEGVREFKAGLSHELIMTGGPAHNQFVEAEAMKKLAVSEGVPAEDIIVEGKAQDTIQNIFYSEQILEAHHWHVVEVVSSPSHLPRASLILAHAKDLKWSTHAAKWPPECSQDKIDTTIAREATYCWTLTHSGFKHSDYLPGS
jgi:uncharacterized SAM-binding protein YcdF (DUF218 family)